MFSRKVSDDFDPTEAFFKGRRHQLRRHLVQRATRNQPGARRIAGLAHVERNIEEQSLYCASVFARECDEWPAIAAREIRRVYVSYWPLQLDALFQEITHGGEDAGVDGLVGFIVG